MELILGEEWSWSLEIGVALACKKNQEEKENRNRRERRKRREKGEKKREGNDGLKLSFWIFISFFGAVVVLDFSSGDEHTFCTQGKMCLG